MQVRHEAEGPTAVLSRRRLLLAAAAAATSGATRALAQTQPPAVRFGGIRVDTRPLASIGGAASDLVQRILPGKLQGVFADLLGPADRRAPVLVARIDRLYLTAFADNNPPISSFGALDYMDGAGVVLAGGQGSQTPLHVTLSPSYSGAYYLPDIDARRVDSLCFQFAYWLRREMNL